MAQYKVIQDIEAEDKLLGPLTLKQFIYAAITIVLGFMAYKFAYLFHSPYIIVLFLPAMLFFGLLAAPFGIDQPNEVWLLAKFRFYLKPQVRKWDQDGVGSLVTVTAPKKIEKKLTKDFTATEAKGRLESLAKILDSGGWITATSGATTFKGGLFNQASEDRLVDLNSITPGQPGSNIIDQDDIFDDNNLQAQHIDSVMEANEKKLKDYQKNLVESAVPGLSSDINPISRSISSFRSPKDYILNAPEEHPFGPIESRFNPKSVIQIDGAQSGGADYGLPGSGPPLAPTGATTTGEVQSSVTTQPDNAKIINVLARENNRSIASIQRELSGGDEVVISLH